MTSTKIAQEWRQTEDLTAIFVLHRHSYHNHRKILPQRADRAEQRHPMKESSKSIMARSRSFMPKIGFQGVPGIVYEIADTADLGSRIGHRLCQFIMVSKQKDDLSPHARSFLDKRIRSSQESRMTAHFLHV